MENATWLLIDFGSCSVTEKGYRQGVSGNGRLLVT